MWSLIVSILTALKSNAVQNLHPKEAARFDRVILPAVPITHFSPSYEKKNNLMELTTNSYVVSNQSATKLQTKSQINENPVGHSGCGMEI